MEWNGGIDEAGYGAVLGPLAHGGVASDRSFDWLTLFESAAIRIGDSKAIYKGGSGIETLESAALFAARLGGWQGDDLHSLLSFLCGSEEFVNRFAPYADTRNISLPMHVESIPLCEPHPQRFRPYARLTYPDMFNLLLNGANKSELAMARLFGVLSRMVADFGRDGSVIVDKQGGRNSYSPYLMRRFRGDMVLISAEGMELSQYNVGADLEISFHVRADSASPLVSLASMIAKYLRELFMFHFNEFWQARVPDIEKTAGYPEDGKRFFSMIEEAFAAEGMSADKILRRK